MSRRAPNRRPSHLALRQVGILGPVAPQSLEDIGSLLDAPSAAVLTTTRKDGTPLTSPVWFRWTGLAARPSVLVQPVPRERRIWDLAGIPPD